MKLNSYDIKVLAGITILSLSVLAIIIIVAMTTTIPIDRYYVMPIGWFVGATMTWAWDKRKYNRLS